MNFVAPTLVAMLALTLAPAQDAIFASRTLYIGGDVSALKAVPHGVYVHSDNPPCGRSVSFISQMKDPAFVGSVGELFGAKAAATVMFVSRADEFIEDCGGGDACKYVRRAAGKEDKASCAALCVKAPAGASVDHLELSNRHGATAIRLSEAEAKAGMANQSTGDWSGWRDVVLVNDQDGHPLACGMATNWSDREDATKVLKMVLR